MVVVISLAAVGLGYATWFNTLCVSAVDDGDDDCFRNVVCNEWPEYMGKDVGSCSAVLLDAHNMQVTLNNAYPYYGCTIDFEITNCQTVPVIVDSVVIAPENFTNGLEVSVDLNGIWVGQQIEVDSFASASLSVRVEQPAAQSFQYRFTITITLIQCDEGGTIGFWGRWDRHSWLTQADVDGWLREIDTGSEWLVEDMDGNGVVDVVDMKAMFDRKKPANNLFLAHYLATRLNGESGRLRMVGVHNVMGYDTDNYLGLANPAAATLAQIIDAIEAKHGTAEPKFEVMKNVCDALNNLLI